jgi:hypothetical protein
VDPATLIAVKKEDAADVRLRLHDPLTDGLLLPSGDEAIRLYQETYGDAPQKTS